jgi:hypothetical protein
LAKYNSDLAFLKKTPEDQKAIKDAYDAWVKD